MTAWLHGGPLDGAVIRGLPALIEAMDFWFGGKVHRYLHEGPPDEADLSSPEAGNCLGYQGIVDRP